MVLEFHRSGFSRFNRMGGFSMFWCRVKTEPIEVDCTLVLAKEIARASFQTGSRALRWAHGLWLNHSNRWRTLAYCLSLVYCLSLASPIIIAIMVLFRRACHRLILSLVLNQQEPSTLLLIVFPETPGTTNVQKQDKS